MLTLFTIAVANVAFAETLAPVASDTRSALPQAGDVELVLEAPPILNSTNLNPFYNARGLSVVTGGGTTTVGLGLNGGAGYFLTDIFEVGGAVAIDYGQQDCFGGGGCSGIFEFAVEPFIKANFGRVLKGIHFSPFIHLGLQAGMAAGPASTGLVGFDLDLGVDFLISRGWGISAFIPGALLDQTASGDAIFNFGVGYGLVTYF